SYSALDSRDSALALTRVLDSGFDPGFDVTPLLTRARALARDSASAFDSVVAQQLGRGREFSISHSSFLTDEMIFSLLDAAIAIEKYLILQTRMHDCKQGALRVSREKWNLLRDRICRPVQDP